MGLPCPQTLSSPQDIGTCVCSIVIAVPPHFFVISCVPLHPADHQLAFVSCASQFCSVLEHAQSHSAAMTTGHMSYPFQHGRCLILVGADIWIKNGFGHSSLFSSPPLFFDLLRVAICSGQLPHTDFGPTLCVLLWSGWCHVHLMGTCCLEHFQSCFLLRFHL